MTIAGWGVGGSLVRAFEVVERPENGACGEGGAEWLACSMCPKGPSGSLACWPARWHPGMLAEPRDPHQTTTVRARACLFSGLADSLRCCT